jgi:hypothetical protein
MKATVQARLDEDTQAALERVMRRKGWSASKVIRESIRLMETEHAPARVRRLIGIGMYDSGRADLATNKKYMDGFGKKSMGLNGRKPTRKAG